MNYPNGRARGQYSELPPTGVHYLAGARGYERSVTELHSSDQYARYFQRPHLL